MLFVVSESVVKDILSNFWVLVEGVLVEDVIRDGVITLALMLSSVSLVGAETLVFTESELMGEEAIASFVESFWAIESDSRSTLLKDDFASRYAVLTFPTACIA
jgi:hypothetical protein